MYTILVHIHSILRWVILIFFVGSLIYAYAKWKGSKAPSNVWIKFLPRIAELQFIFGIVLYFTSSKVIFAASSMKHTITRFFLVEHITLMVIAIALLSIAGSKWKKSAKDSGAAKKLFVFLVISLILMLISIPWPFRGLGSAWI